MNLRTRFLVFLLIALSVIASACSASGSSTASPAGTSNPTAAATTALDGSTLIQERCSVCHPASIVGQRAHTAEEWKSIVDSMVMRGAQLSSGEETVVVGYLSNKFTK